jgi:hypothetical protein
MFTGFIRSPAYPIIHDLLEVQNPLGRLIAHGAEIQVSACREVARYSEPDRVCVRAAPWARGNALQRIFKQPLSSSTRHGGARKTQSSGSIRSARRLAFVRQEERIKLVYPKPFGRALGKALEAAFGPQPPALGLQGLEVEISQCSFPFAGFCRSRAPDRRVRGVHPVLAGELAPAFETIR